MFLRNTIMQSTLNYSQQINKLKTALKNADAVLIGAGAGLSASAGFTYSGSRFYKYFADFSDKYGIIDMYSGGFYPYQTLEEYWAWWSRHIYYNRYVEPSKPVYDKLYGLVKDKDYFVITTNVDHCFQKAGFDKKRLFYTQGDYGLFQCSIPCHEKTYDNEDLIRRMVVEQKEMKIPSELIPLCPICGKPMTVNLRCDDRFVQDAGWEEASQRYESFVENHKNSRVLILELGVGGNTPVIIKYPFWRLTYQNPKSTYACINYKVALCPSEIEKQAICIDDDIGKAIGQIDF
ncbi:MAG: Sir2 silent information regulator family NAD-dependent deacetylase [Clostridia bacterium]|nr:Sir2 silent information regulator family NAD-dependent deacetylase [Clostridia bacterium]